MKPRIKRGEEAYLWCSSISLKDVLEKLSVRGIKECDYSNVSIEICYDDCYYESDPPSLKISWTDIY